MRLAATLEYDGTEFSGFQRQNNAETIQEHIESSLKKITNENITINYQNLSLLKKYVLFKMTSIQDFQQ